MGTFAGGTLLSGKKVDAETMYAVLYLESTELTDDECDLFYDYYKTADKDKLLSLREIVQDRVAGEEIINEQDLTIGFLINLMDQAFLAALKKSDDSVPFMKMWPTMKRDILADHHDLFHDEASEYIFRDADPDDEQ